jgi:hypothetical protein
MPRTVRLVRGVSERTVAVGLHLESPTKRELAAGAAYRDYHERLNDIRGSRGSRRHRFGADRL